jgi:DNA-binding PadR family transcriptional regulator
MRDITEMLKGVLEGCVLEIIGRGETYGYLIAQQLRELGFEDVVEGTVYAILIRLERQGLVLVERKASTQGPPRKFFQLNEAGQARREQFWLTWHFVSDTINQLTPND